MTKNKLKILFIPRWYPDRTDSLKGIFVKRHALAVALRHDVAVMYVNADPELKGKIYDSEFSVEDGIKTVRVYYNNSASSFIKLFRYLKSCAIGTRIIKGKFGIPDVSHIHVLSRTFFPARYFKRNYNTPIVITEQWSGYLREDGSYKGFLKKLITRKAIGMASAVTTVSKSLRDAMHAHGLRNEYSIIPNVVDVNKFFPPELKIVKEKFILLTVADLDDRAKNISGAIKAIQLLSQTRKDFEYHIIGDGTDKHFLMKTASDNGLIDKQIFFHGSKPSSEVAVAMREADLFVLFSHYDNMPSVMAEAFASGLPVIGSAVHGMKEHITDKLGRLVQPGDEKSLCEAVDSALTNINSFDRNYLRQYALDNFSYEAVSQKFDEIYQKVSQ